MWHSCDRRWHTFVIWSAFVEGEGGSAPPPTGSDYFQLKVYLLIYFVHKAIITALHGTLPPTTCSAGVILLPADKTAGASSAYMRVSAVSAYQLLQLTVIRSSTSYRRFS